MAAHHKKSNKAKPQPAPKVTIAEMLVIAEKISAQTGHYPSVGELQVRIDTGELRPEDYLGRRAV